LSHTRINDSLDFERDAEGRFAKGTPSRYDLYDIPRKVVTRACENPSCGRVFSSHVSQERRFCSRACWIACGAREPKLKPLSDFQVSSVLELEREGYSYTEIAKILKVSYSTTMRTLERKGISIVRKDSHKGMRRCYINPTKFAVLVQINPVFAVELEAGIKDLVSQLQEYHPSLTAEVEAVEPVNRL